MMKKIEGILKIIFLLLISILVIIIIIQKIETQKNENTSKYISWCRNDYLGNDYPSQEWLKECFNNYQTLEKDLKK